MNLIFWIILIALIVEFLIGTVSTVLNMRSLSSTPPRGLEDIYESAGYERSQEYTLANAKFGLIFSTIKLPLGLIFWFAGGFNYVDQFLLDMHWNEIITGIMFIGVLGLLNMVVDMPFSLYSTFVIEQKFGFNKTTYGTFLLDMVKSLAISIAIGIPILAGVLYFFSNAGSMGWLIVWIFITLISLAMVFIAPVWIMPLFNKFTPLQAGALRNAIANYAETVHFKYGDIYVIDGSKRSSHSNAFFTGFGKTKRIALFDTLVEQLNNEEIVSVIAHEVGHSKKKHILSSTLLGILHTGALLFILSLFMENQMLFDAFYMETTSVYGSIVFFGVLFTPVEMVISPLVQLISRKNEHQADEWAVQTTTNREYLITSLKKLAANNLSNLSPHRFFVILNYSHPPLAKRINYINNIHQR